jgi:hypothetical protein
VPLSYFVTDGQVTDLTKFYCFGLVFELSICGIFLL